MHTKNLSLDVVYGTSRLTTRSIALTILDAIRPAAVSPPITHSRSHHVTISRPWISGSGGPRSNVTGSWNHAHRTHVNPNVASPIRAHGKDGNIGSDEYVIGRSSGWWSMINKLFGNCCVSYRPPSPGFLDDAFVKVLPWNNISWDPPVMILWEEEHRELETN